MSLVREREFHLKKKLLHEPGKYIIPLPSPFTRSVIKEPNTNFSVSSCGPSSAGHITHVSHLPSRSSSLSPSTGPGLSTEHSSICSWKNDDFERANTHRVHQLFCCVDELLYEGRASSRSEALQDECEEWNRHTPHLRILGNQLEPPKHEGVEIICRPELNTRVLCFPTPKREDHSELCVVGHGLTLKLWSEHSVLNNSSSFSLNEEEETYEAEGSIVEFLAYDRKEIEDEEPDKRKSSTLSAKGGVPRVSPHACIRDTVADELFDDVWREVVDLIQELLHKNWEKQLFEGTTRRSLESSSRSQLPVKGHSVLLSRGSSRCTFLSTWSNNAQESSVFPNKLNGVMTVQSKPLQKRHHGFAERDTQDPIDDQCMMCIKSQALKSSTFFIQKPGAQRRLPRLAGRVRTHHNLTGNGSQLSRGTRLSTVTECLPSPPETAFKQHRLPQINSEFLEQEYSAPVPRLVQLRGRILRGGVSGVMPPVNNLPPLRETTLMLESLSRPNTTHTFRSDTPMKRSFTPLDFASNIRTSRGFGKGENLAMGVTGFSLGITCSTASGFSECSISSRKRSTVLCGSEAEGGNVALLSSIGGGNHLKQLSRYPGQVRRKIQSFVP